MILRGSSLAGDTLSIICRRSGDSSVQLTPPEVKWAPSTYSPIHRSIKPILRWNSLRQWSKSTGEFKRKHNPYVWIWWNNGKITWNYTVSVLHNIWANTGRFLCALSCPLLLSPFTVEMRARESNPITNSVPRCNPISHVYLFKGVTASGLKIHESPGISSKWLIQFPSSGGRASVDTFQCRAQDKIVCLLFTDYEHMTSVRLIGGGDGICSTLVTPRPSSASTYDDDYKNRIYICRFFNPNRKKWSYISCLFVIYHWPDHSHNLPEQQTQQLPSTALKRLPFYASL